MKTKTIGFVLTKIKDKNIIEGYFEKTGVNRDSSDDSAIILRKTNVSIPFTLQLDAGKITILEGTLDQAKEISKELKKMVSTDLKLFFNEKEYKI